MTTVTFSDGRLHPASYLVYFNGIEIPTLQVTVDFGVWLIPTASVEIAPDPVMQRIGAEDRMQVAIFYLDDTYGTEFTFRLLFEGEITGWETQNTPMGRRISFSCVSNLRVLNEIYQYFITDTRSWTTAAMSKDPSQLQVFTLFPFIDLLFHGLDHKETVKRPFDILRNVLGVCLKKETQEAFGSLAMKHFFAAFSRRIDFVNRFVPSPVLEIDVEDNACVFTTLSAVRDHGVIKELMRKSKKFDNGASLWSMLRSLFTSMYYEILALPAPPIAQVRVPSGAVKGGPAWPAPENHANRILNFVTKPQWLYGVPPACNVIFPSMIRQFNYSEDYASQPTRVNINDTYWTTLWRGRKNMWDSVFDIRVAYPDQAQEEIDKIIESGEKGNPIDTGRNFLIWPEEFFKGPRCEEEVLPELFQFLTESAGMQAQEDPELSAVMVADYKKTQRTYAEYEYMRRRGMRRNGSVVIDFDPYFIPGFPTMIFDPTAFVHAYALRGSHTLSQNQMVTSINFTYAQTVYELLEKVIEARQKGYDIDTAPAYPVQQVREAIQVNEVAEKYFSELLHQAGGYEGVKSAAFDFHTALKLVSEGKGDITPAEAIKDPALLDDYFEFKPAQNFEEIFNSPDHARNYVSRPVVTLEEYIKFHPRGKAKGEVTAFDSVQGKGAVFWEEILELVQGPGPQPKYDAEKKAYLPVAEPIVDTRADWRKRLKNYKKRALSLVGQK